MKSDRSAFSNCKGLVLALLCGAVLSTVSVLVKHMKNIHPAQLSMYKYLAVFAFTLPDAVRCGKNLIGPKGFRLILVFRAIAGAANNYGAYLAFRYLPLGEAAVIIFTAPVFITVFSRIFLKEAFSVIQGIAVLMSVVGIILISKIPLFSSAGTVAYTTENVYGLLAALSTLLFRTCTSILLRKLKGVHHAVVMFHFSCGGLIPMLAFTALTADFNLHFCGYQPWFVIGVGLFSYLGHALLTFAMKFEHAGPVSTLRASSDIVLSFLWQIFFFHDYPNGSAIAGAVLVCFSIALIGFGKLILASPEQSKWLRCLGFGL